MKLANVNSRAVLVTGADTGIDVQSASSGQFSSDPAEIFEVWADFLLWAASLDTDAERESVVRFDRRELRSPSPRPRQVFAIGLNYRAHAAESGFSVPTELPPTFTKFVSALSGPDTTVSLPVGGHTDWEVELVAVIGATAHGVQTERAWNHVAGLTVGQDLSERIVQLQGPAPQFGLGKSFPGFAPVGPWLVTLDEVTDRDDLALGCSVNDEVVQLGRTRDLTFPVAALVSELSRIVTLLPGDLIFTGTPAGVGVGRDPQRFLRPGDELVSWIDGIGQLRQRFV